MLRRMLLSMIANAVAIYALTYFFDKITMEGGIKGFIIAGLLFGFLNSLVKPFLKLISLPFVFLTAGLFIFVINGLILWVLKFSLEVLDFEGVRLVIAGGILTYLFASIVLALVNTVTHWLIKK